MKKFLLSLLCLISFMAINAEEVTLSYSDVIELGKSGGGAGFNKTIDPISFSFSDAYGNSAHIKAYGKSSITLSGASITKVVITATTSSYIKTWEANEGNISVSSNTATWEGTSTNLVLNNTATAQARITSIVVTYTTSGGGEVVETVAKPTFSVASGVFTEPFDLTLSAEEGNLSIILLMAQILQLIAIFLMEKLLE